MAGFTVTIETPKIHLGGFFSEFWRILSADKVAAEDKIKKILLDYARGGHGSGGKHYQSQTGQLNASTKTDGSFGLGSEIRLYVDQTQVDYAQYIIEVKYFDDPFIDESLRANMPEINAIVIKLYGEAVTKFNNLP